MVRLRSLHRQMSKETSSQYPTNVTNQLLISAFMPDAILVNHRSATTSKRQIRLWVSVLQISDVREHQTRKHFQEQPTYELSIRTLVPHWQKCMINHKFWSRKLVWSNCVIAFLVYFAVSFWINRRVSL